MPHASPRRRRGENRSNARKRWKSTGLCQGCGKKKNTSGALCGGCIAKKNRRYGPKRNDWR